MTEGGQEITSTRRRTRPGNAGCAGLWAVVYAELHSAAPRCTPSVTVLVKPAGLLGTAQATRKSDTLGAE